MASEGGGGGGCGADLCSETCLCRYERTMHLIMGAMSLAQVHREFAPLEQSARSRQCAPWCAAGPVPAAEARLEPRAAPTRCLRQTTRRTLHPRLVWTSVSVELCSQPHRPCPSSVPAGRGTFHLPPPCRSWAAADRAIATLSMSAGVAVFSATRNTAHWKTPHDATSSILVDEIEP